MQLFYDRRDEKAAERVGDLRLYWLDDLGARPLDEARRDEEGFLFAGARPMDDYSRLVSGLPHLRDRADERKPLLQLDSVLDVVEPLGVPTPRTWRLKVDEPLPGNLAFPLFVRTGLSSWKLGGHISRVNNERELLEESAALRRGFHWDALILAREWLDLAKAGESRRGLVPQEIRVWIVDQVPVAWSFHYLQVVREPDGFPPSTGDMEAVKGYSSRIGKGFRSRLVVADFARLEHGKSWVFIEAGPGSCAGTAHEAVFKNVARALLGERVESLASDVGGVF